MKKILTVFFKRPIMGMLLGSLVIVLSACGLSEDDDYPLTEAYINESGTILYMEAIGD